MNEKTIGVTDEEGYVWIVPLSVYSKQYYPVNSTWIMKELTTYYNQLSKNIKEERN